MRCTNPFTVGFHADGKTLCWSPKNYSKQYAPFQLPCGKCISCRLEYARQWATRCVHEAQMYGDNNIFLTLTYNDENLGDNKLDYSDFQKFIKRLRKQTDNTVSYFATGEYGEKSKRKHWHAIIFNFKPTDTKYKYTNEQGHKLYDSKFISNIWTKGNHDFGSVTFDSAGYVARYSAKKLTHGYDGEHEYQPISKKSSKHAIGKKWLEKYWPDVFNYGRVILPNGQSGPIPRYYEKWFQKNHPEKWEHYVTQTKLNKILTAQLRETKIDEEEFLANSQRDIFKEGLVIDKYEINTKIMKQRLQMLNQHAKL